jgi:hypothetical protein
LTARIYKIQDPDTEVYVHILGSDGATPLTTPLLFDVNVDNAWNDLDLSGRNIIVTGDFYIAIEYLEYGPHIGRTWDVVGWRSYRGEPGNWIGPTDSDDMIRAVVEETGPVSGEILPINLLQLLAPYLTIVTVIVGASAILYKKRIS